MTTVGQLAAALDEFAPTALAEPWDNVGLLAGDPSAQVARVLSTLDLTDGVLEEAANRGSQAIVCFHPPIFRPLTRVRADDAVGRLVWRALHDGRSLLATHTALDKASPGTNDFMAAALGVTVTGPLRRHEDDRGVKLVVFCPPEATQRVMDAMAEAGAGHIGLYDECSFRTAGEGTFRGLIGTNPRVGLRGRSERVQEERLEMVAPRPRLAHVVAAMRAAHPYEEVAFDTYPVLSDPATALGAGRIGHLAEGESLGAFAQRVEAATGALHLRVVGDLKRPVQRVALLGGSGGSYVAEAAAAGVDVLVTGDLSHHDALLASRLKLAVVDPGHYASERLVVSQTAEFLREVLPELTVFESIVDGEPFTRRAGG